MRNIRARWCYSPHVESGAVGRDRRPTTSQRGYGHQHQRASRLQRAMSPECAWCQATEDLVADHLVAKRPDLGYQTLCRPCNNRKARGYTGPKR